VFELNLWEVFRHFLPPGSSERAHSDRMREEGALFLRDLFERVPAQASVHGPYALAHDKEVPMRPVWGLYGV
jgi:hypothetical protein